MGEVIVITSGKGGVGKTTSSASIGTGLAKREKSVVMIDTDIGLRNLDVVLDVYKRQVQGSSIELSADGPLRPPYTVFFQGGITWYHAKYGILMSLQKLVDAGFKL